MNETRFICFECDADVPPARLCEVCGGSAHALDLDATGPNKAPETPEAGTTGAHEEYKKSRLTHECQQGVDNNASH